MSKNVEKDIGQGGNRHSKRGQSDRFGYDEKTVNRWGKDHSQSSKGKQLTAGSKAGQAERLATPQPSVQEAFDLARVVSLQAPNHVAKVVSTKTEVAKKAVSAAFPLQPEYVDPYLYESGFFASPVERKQLLAATPIKPRIAKK